MTGQGVCPQESEVDKNGETAIHLRVKMYRRLTVFVSIPSEPRFGTNRYFLKKITVFILHFDVFMLSLHAN
jgi:hypothetical protein